MVVVDDAGQVAGEVVHRVGATGFGAIGQLGQGDVEPEVAQVLLLRPEDHPSGGRVMPSAPTTRS